MIEEIRIASLGVIEESTLELGPGFTAITGETGAGKTMVVTALGLLLGGRADTGAVRRGAKHARVEGLVRLVNGSERWSKPLAARVDELGGEVEDDALVVARQISAEGRSRAFAGGASVPVSALSGLIDPLVAVHGQSDQHRLLQPAAQRDALDRFAGRKADKARAAYTATYDRLRAVETELREVTETARERAREADLLRFGLNEVEQVDPQQGEDAALAAEESRLGFADTLRTAAEQARECLSSESTAGDVGTDALGAVSAARKLLDGVRDHDAEAASLADRLAEVSYLLSDVAADVSSYAASLETDPARLAAVSERRAALTALTRKYGETIDEVLAWAEQGSARLLELEGTDERIEQLRAEVDALRAKLAEQGAALSALREKAAAKLGAVVTGELTALAMPHAVEVALAATHPVPTFVFDEVDAGVGGKAAVEVGRRLAMLARHAQVLVVTHLPQVAAFADQHVVVVKSHDGTVTTSGLTTLDDSGRVRELSRMLAGLEDSETALAHAEELLATAQEVRSSQG